MIEHDGAPRGDGIAAGNGRLLSFGGFVGAVVVGATLAAAPAALRLTATAPTCSLSATWAGLAGLALAPMAAASLALRHARSGYRALGTSSTASGAVTQLAWLLLTFLFLTGLGAGMRARTHHHALAGVVFALVGLAAALVLAIGSRQVVTVLQKSPVAIRWGVAIAAAATLGFGLAVLRHKLSAASFPEREAAKLVDGTAFFLAALLTSSASLSQRRWLALAGPPLVAGVLLLGVSGLKACPNLGEALGERAPTFSWLYEVVRSH